MYRRAKNALRILAFIVVLIGVGKLLRYLLVDDTTSYTRVTYHEMYEQENIDILFVGSSHCYRGFVPSILDAELSLNTFNAGSSSQLMNGSYLLIKEAARYNDIQHIYLDMFYEVALEKWNVPTASYIISDYLRPSFDKYAFLLDATESDNYMNSFFIARRDWQRAFDFEYISNLLARKQTDAYKNYWYDYISGDVEKYSGKGYVSNATAIQNWAYCSDVSGRKIEFNNFTDIWKRDLNNIIAFCNKKGIALTLVNVPIPNYFLSAIEDYDDYINYVNDIIKDTDVELWDFNLCKEQFFPNTSELFMDEDHLNCYGAEQFSRLFAKLVNEDLDANEVFYKSYAEKMLGLAPSVFGVTYTTEEESGAGFRKCRIVSNRDLGLEYAITVEPDGEKPYVVRDYAEGHFFDLPMDLNAFCTIDYRIIGSDEKIGSVRVRIP